MSKVIKSPVDHFAGEVTLSDPLTFPQVFAIEDVLNASKELGEDTTVARYHHSVLPGILVCVEKWDLKGGGFPKDPTVDTFPATPREESSELIAWLMNEIVELYAKADPDPEA